MKKISIILPVYNIEKFLANALKSVVNQNLNDIEIICINDGSTDNSLEILKEFQQKDERIILINQENQGSGIARNNGMRIATGEYIGFLDADDYLYNRNVLSNLYNKAKSSNSNMCGGNFKIIHDDSYKNTTESDEKIKEKEKIYKDFTNFIFKEEKIAKAEDYKSTGWFWRFIYNREFLEKNNINFPDYKRFSYYFFKKYMQSLFLFYFFNQI